MADNLKELLADRTGARFEAVATFAPLALMLPVMQQWHSARHGMVQTWIRTMSVAELAEMQAVIVWGIIGLLFTASTVLFMNYWGTFAQFFRHQIWGQPPGFDVGAEDMDLELPDGENEVIDV